MATQIDWSDFPKETFDAIQNIVGQKQFLDADRDPAFQPFQDASLRIGAYEGRIVGQTYEDELPFSWGTKEHPNVLALRIDYHPVVNGKELYDSRDAIDIPIAYWEKPKTAEASIILGDACEQPIATYEEFQSQMQAYAESFVKGETELQYPQLLQENYADILKEDLQKKKDQLSEMFPSCQAKEAENQDLYPALLSPKHPVIVLPEGFVDETKTYEWAGICAKNEAVEKASNGRIVPRVWFENKERPEDLRFYGTLEADGRTLVTEYYGNNLLEAANGINRRADIVASMMKRMDAIYQTDPSTLPKKEAQFVKNYQKYLQAETAAMPNTRNSYERDRLLTIATKVAIDALQKEKLSRRETIALLNKYAPGEPLMPPSFYARSVVNQAERSIQAENSKHAGR